MNRLSRATLLGVLASVVAVGATSTPTGAAPAASRTGPSAAATSSTLLGSSLVRSAAAGGEGRPNIVLITTDDMTDKDLRYMPRTRRLLARKGVAFRDFISPHPLCCPARAEILTGQYAQNNGVRHNEGPHGGFRAHDPSHTLATWLRSAGYGTAFVGKYLNHYYRRDGMVPGWDEFNPTLRGTYSPYGFTTYNSGSPRSYEKLYIADMVTRETRRYIRDFSGDGRPFFVWASHIAPHGMHVDGRWVPPVPARRHAGLFADLTAPSLRDPAFAEPNVGDKPRFVRAARPVAKSSATILFQRRIRSLQAVDEGVQRIVRTLRRTGELANSVLVFTSDNGHLNGEHGLRGKNYPYEQALQVPFLVRGPGMPAGVTRDQTMTTVDLAPTLVDLAKATPDLTVDGRTMLPAIRRAGAPGYGTALIQAGSSTRPWFFRGVRTSRYTYARYFHGFTELYDRHRDPAQLRNVAGQPEYAAVEAELAVRYRSLADCSGVTCRTSLEPLPRLRR